MNGVPRPSSEKHVGVNKSKRITVLAVVAALVSTTTLIFRGRLCSVLEDNHHKSSEAVKKSTMPPKHTPKKTSIPIPRITPSSDPLNENSDGEQKLVVPDTAAKTPICKLDDAEALQDKEILCKKYLPYADEFLAKAKISNNCDEIASDLQGAINNLIQCAPLILSHSNTPEVKDIQAYIKKIRSDRDEVRNRAQKNLQCVDLPSEDQQNWENENIWCNTYKTDDDVSKKKLAFIDNTCRYQKARAHQIEEKALRSNQCEDIQEAQETLRLSKLVCAPITLNSPSTDKESPVNKLEAEQSDIDSRIDALEESKLKDCN